jgi:hypothetical protein
MAYDATDGLEKASGLFVEHAIEQLQQVKTLHIILLVVTLCILLLFVVFLFRPYVVAHEEETKAIAGMLSHLPAEVNVESHIRTFVMGITRPEGELSMANGRPGSLPGMSFAGMPGMMVPGMMPPYGAGAMMMAPGSYGAMGMGTMQGPGVYGSAAGGWGQQQRAAY